MYCLLTYRTFHYNVRLIQMNTVVQPTSAAKLYPSTTTATAAANQQNTPSSSGFRSKRNSAANQRLRYLNEQTAHVKRDSQHAATDGSDTVSVGQQTTVIAGNDASTILICYSMTLQFVCAQSFTPIYLLLLNIHTSSQFGTKCQAHTIVI
jgi:hypothetical protein